MNIKELIEKGEFGTKRYDFYHDGKAAIKYLIEVQEGECVAALYHPQIGDIDIVWGENDANNKGFGLKHIIEKHGVEIAELGYNIEDFISITLQFGELKPDKRPDRINLMGKMFKIVISKVAYKNGKKWDKTYILTAFDLRPQAMKNR
jgi:hypothetical protein